jgi:hypothetical protein
MLAHELRRDRRASPALRPEAARNRSLVASNPHRRLSGALCLEFPSIASWWEYAIKPAFAENLTVLYLRTWQFVRADVFGAI